MGEAPSGEPRLLTGENLDALVGVLAARGWTVVGPTVRDGAVVYDRLASARDLPEGWSDEQGPGTYRLRRTGGPARFSYSVGPHSWKQFLFPPERLLWRAAREGAGFRVLTEDTPPPRYAFLGVRACELAAIAVQDRVFLGGTYTDPDYRARRERAFLVAVNCGQAGASCFCASLGTGPRATSGYDLVLTELLDGERHDFLVAAGSEPGRQVLDALPTRPAAPADLAAAEQATAHAAAQQVRAVALDGLKAALEDRLDSPRWDEIAGRCLTCGNCTQVCPTCFCVAVEDTTDLAGMSAARLRRWDSCFSLDFSYLHGGSVRRSGKARYRQWLTHKFAGWVDQFGTVGCVGCGRCITWCPAGIDITAELASLRAEAAPAGEGAHDGGDGPDDA
ncbi:MAG TPA: 4Fe-4S dicluster domain-containing protein [Thermomicrobiaceae bacterium]|nr:4Fe-4S dicluster domain-containing protein [Thermomicrobiaceae bacterium]